MEYSIRMQLISVHCDYANGRSQCIFPTLDAFQRDTLIHLSVFHL